MTTESVTANLQSNTAPFSAVRLLPVKMRVELRHEIALVWLSMTFTPLTVRVGVVIPVKCVTVKSPAMKEPLQIAMLPGSLQV